MNSFFKIFLAVFLALVVFSILSFVFFCRNCWQCYVWLGARGG